MKISLFLIFSILLIVKNVESLTGTMCNIIDKNALFTLNFMSQETDYEYIMDDNSTLYF
jgi:hypothetical protein